MDASPIEIVGGPWPTTMLRTAPTPNTGLVSRSALGFTEAMQETTFGGSGGQRKRVSLAAGIAREPDLLFLDEPTNHLDLEGWVVEQWMRRAEWKMVFITHDKTFLEETAKRIIELSAVYPGGTFKVEAAPWTCVAKKNSWTPKPPNSQPWPTRFVGTLLGCGKHQGPRDPPQEHGGRHQRPQGGSQNHHRPQ